jgi:hypothetical protein
VYQHGDPPLFTGMTRKAIIVLALLGAALPTASASAQTPPPLPGGGGLPPILTAPPTLTPFPGTVGPTIRQFDCHTYWIRSSEPPHKYEQQTVCFGFEVVP